MTPDPNIPTIDVPFKLPIQLIPELVVGMAREMAEEVPETDEGKQEMFDRWVRFRAIQTISNVRYAAASDLVDVSDLDYWKTW